MSEATLAVGQALRDAREAQGLTIDDAAVRLRLMHRQIEAMEIEDFESLGQPVFARGFVRNYARLLGLDPEPLLATMQGAPAEPAPVSQAELPAHRSWLTSPWLIVALLGLLAVIAVPVGLYWWLNSEVDEAPAAPAPVVVRPAPAPVPAVVPQPAAPEQTPAAAPLEATAAPAVAPAPEAGAAEAPAPAAPEPAAMRSVLHLEFGGESWVEIKDASGRMLHRQLNRPGASAEIHGQPPFDVVIGNAAQARLTYNGRPIDLKPFIDLTVARFTLEE